MYRGESVLSNLGQPPGMAPEAETPGLFRQWQAKTKETLDGPKGKIVSALLAQQLGQAGQMFAPGLMTRRSSPVNQYGNY